MARTVLRWSYVLTSILGAVAAALTVAGFLPQAWRIIKTRETKDLATPMWILSTTSFALWTAYGALLGKLPIIVPNVLCCLLAGFILAMKLLPRRKRDQVADAVSNAVGADTTPGHPM